MKKLFVHQPLFRLLSPVLSGVFIYLLVLLLNNNIAQIQEEFFNEELYFCIALSYLIQEFSRLLLLLFKRILTNQISIKNILLQVSVSMLLCIVLASTAIHLYFKFILGFSVTFDEIFVFDIIFCTITFLYILLYISHQYLYKINTEKLQQEEINKKNIEEEFKQFKKGINPNLLFESLEALLVLVKKDKEKADELIDYLAAVYRYILSGKEKQLTAITEELIVVHQLIKLFNYLPYVKVSFSDSCANHFLVVPGSLLRIIEQIIRTTIIGETERLDIQCNESDNSIEITYHKNDRIMNGFDVKKIEDVVKTYQIYSKDSIEIKEDKNIRKIVIPKLKIKE